MPSTARAVTGEGPLRLLLAAAAVPDDASPVALLDDYDSFMVVVRVMLNHVSRYTSSPLTIVIDEGTAAEVAIDRSRLQSACVLHTFGADSEIDDTGGVRVVALFSDTLNVAATGRRRSTASGPNFEGGWTAYRPLVESIVTMTAPEAAMSPATVSAHPTRTAQGESSRGTELCAMSLAAALANHYALRHMDISRDKDELTSVLSILKSISAKRRAHDLLYVFVEQIAAVTGVDRCSIVRVWGGDNNGHVVASHEDASVHDLIINLEKYPEIQRAMDTHSAVVVNDVHRDPLTQPYSRELAAAGISAIVVIPIVLFDIDVGSFFLRAALKGRSFNQREISFCEIVGEAASNALERAHLFESIQKANQRLERLAITDGLTGLYNFRHFRDRLQEEFDRAVRYKLSLGCVLVDIDDFKSINDTYGHLQGDAVLRELALRVSRCARKSDVVARYGGEEIIALLPQTDMEGAVRYAQRVLSAVSSMPYEGLPEDRAVTVSVGVAVLEGAVLNDCERLVAAADEALYRAKTSGKNRVEVYRSTE